LPERDARSRSPRTHHDRAWRDRTLVCVHHRPDGLPGVALGRGRPPPGARVPARAAPRPARALRQREPLPGRPPPLAGGRPLSAPGLGFMIHRTLQIPQTMAATGLFYIAILFVLVGELLGRLILFRTSLPL